jgi:hypothetical protein
MRLLVLVAALACSCGAPRPFGEGVSLHTMLTGGYRALNHDQYDGGPAYGLELVTRDGSGWGYELGGTYSAEDQSGPHAPEAEFNEVGLGLRRGWEGQAGGARSYVGFGGAFTRVDHTLHQPFNEFEDEGGAAYLHGGVAWNLGRYDFDHGTEVLLGFDLRGLVGDDYEYAQLSLVLGFGR